MKDNIDTFIEMIPLYLNDQLDSDQKIFFEGRLEQDRQLEKEVEEYSMLKQSYSHLSTTLPSPSPDVFSRIMENIEHGQEKRVAQESIFNKISEYIKNFLSTPKLAWSVAAVQMAVILFFVFSFPGEIKFQTLSTNEVQLKTGIKINIVFHDMAVEKQIRDLLNDLNANIISGPSKTGLYIILIKDTPNKANVLNILKNSALVKFAQARY
jgi:hypothetical protein